MNKLYISIHELGWHKKKPGGEHEVYVKLDDMIEELEKLYKWAGNQIGKQMSDYADDAYSECENKIHESIDKLKA